MLQLGLPPSLQTGRHLRPVEPPGETDGFRHLPLSARLSTHNYPAMASPEVKVVDAEPEQAIGAFVP